MTTDLDTFEAQLLAELRTTVTARAGNQPLLQPASELRLRRRIAAAWGGVAAAVAGAFLLPGVLASPAYAVHDGPGGTIDVQVNRLDDAAGLQRALADHGVNADVQYLGNNMKCTPRRYSQASAVLDSSTRFAVGKGISVELDRRDVADGETVVIAASRIPNGIRRDWDRRRPGQGLPADPSFPQRPERSQQLTTQETFGSAADT